MNESNKDLVGKRIIITGCGFAKLQTIFTNIVDGKPSHNEILIDGQAYKMNMGSTTAQVLAMHGATIHMVSRTEKNLKALKEHIAEKVGGSEKIEYSAVDLMKEEDVERWIKSLSTDLPIYWFHSVGASAGNINPIGNRWLPFSKLKLEHFSTEALPFWAATINIANYLWPIFEKQRESRVVLISSMSAIRCYASGASHCAATAALDRLANVLMLASYKKNIFVTTLRAGAIDTGTYESKEVQSSVVDVSDEYDGRWRNEQITLAPPESIGELAACAFSITAHVTSMNIVSQGQFPNEGS